MASSPLTAVPLLLAAFFLAACNGEAPPEAEQAPKPQPSRAAPTETAPPEDSAILLEPVGFAALPGWEQDRLGAALPALNRSCARLTAQPAARPLGPDGLAGTVGDWRAPCAAPGTTAACPGDGGGGCWSCGVSTLGNFLKVSRDAPLKFGDVPGADGDRGMPPAFALPLTGWTGLPGSWVVPSIPNSARRSLPG